MSTKEYFEEFVGLLSDDILEPEEELDRDIPVSKYVIVRSFGPDFQIISFHNGNRLTIPKILARIGREFWKLYGPRIKDLDGPESDFARTCALVYSGNPAGVLERILGLARNGGTAGIRETLGARFPGTMFEPIVLSGPYSERNI